MRNLLLLLILLLLLTGCEKPKAKKPSSKPLNLTMVLDLSNRIHADKAPSQATADLAFIEEITKDFESLVAVKGYVGSTDRLSIALCYADSIGDKNKVLRLDVSALPLKDRRRIFNQNLNQFLHQIQERYAQITTQTHEGGSNLYAFFKDDYRELADHQNRVILITDGYLDFSIRKRIKNRSSYCLMDELRELENWQEAFESMDYGFLSVEKTFPQTTIQVIGIAPRPGLNEFVILQAYWKDWFDDMQMKRFDFQKGFSDVRILPH